MKTSKRCALFLLLFAFPACGQQLVEFPQADGARPDTVKTDAAIADGVIPDARSADVVGADRVATDAASPDILKLDVASVDGVLPDAGNPEVASVDGVLPDASNADLANTDDVATNDAIADAPIPDDGAADVANRDASNTDTFIGGTIIDGPMLDSEIDVQVSDVFLVVDSSLADALFTDAPESDISNADVEAADLASIDSSATGPAIVVNLGLASPFAIAATAGVTNTPTVPITHINGDVVLTPTQTCNGVTVDNAGGFGLCGGMPPTISNTVITSVYPNTTTAAAVKADMNAAFLSITPLAGPPAVGSLGGGTAIAAPTTLGNDTGSALVLGDNLFTAGVYASTTSILVTGDLTLDGQGDPNAVFVFQSASTLTTADGAPSPSAHARILLTNGTKASNVWWQVASSATLGLYTEFQGNIMAAFDITMKTGATACGRSMAGAWVGGAGTYVFDSNVVSVPGNGCPL